MTVTTPTSEVQHLRHTPPSRAGFRLSARLRKVTLIVHLSSVAAWFGMHVVLGVLTFTALSGPAASAPAFAISIAMFVGWPLVTVALLTLLSGLVLALGSKFGLFRYWWVTTKLVLTVVLITLVLLVLIPSVAELAASASDAPDGFTLSQQLIAPPIVSSSALLFTIAISVIKPWGRTRRVGTGAR